MKKFAQFFLSLFLSFVLLLSACPLAGALTFPDGEQNWAREVIGKVSDLGLMKGYPDGRFGVGEYMTRGEFATLLVRMFGWEKESPETPAFADTAPSAWYYSAVETVCAHGAAERNTVFRPEDYISRAEICVMLIKALGWDSLAQGYAEDPLPFDDVRENQGYISLAYRLGIIEGVPRDDGSLVFLPSFSAPREQVAAMAVRTYEKLYGKTEWINAFYAVSSFSQLNLAADCDCVSLGWAKMVTGDDAVSVLTEKQEGNSWYKPQGAETVTSFLSEKGIDSTLNVFASATAFSAALALADGREAMLSALLSAAESYPGLCIDFEGFRDELRQDFTDFMTDLRERLPAEKPLFVCVPPDTWYGGYDYRALGQICDKVIVMAHDYQWTSVPESYVGTPRTDSPVTPIDKVFETLLHVTDPETGVEDKSKIALQLNFDGTCGFAVDENGNLTETRLYHPTTATIAKRLSQPDTVRTWDEKSRNPYIEYTAESGTKYKLWYEDEESIADKIKLARFLGIRSLSVWRLGNVPQYDTVPFYRTWDVVTSGRK